MQAVVLTKLGNMKLLMIFIFVLTSVVCVSAQPDYEFMKHVVQWPPTICRKEKCKPDKVTERFSIHGLWPINAGGGDTACPTDPTYHPGDDRPKFNQMLKDNNLLSDNLKIVWPTLLVGWTDEKFWFHEWEKHGRCSNKTVNMSNYFLAATRVMPKNLMEYLKMAGMNPSNHTLVETQDVTRALYPLVGRHVNVHISCTNNKTHDFLDEIHLCQDKKLKTFTSCPLRKDIRGCQFPKIVPSFYRIGWKP